LVLSICRLCVFIRVQQHHPGHGIIFCCGRRRGTRVGLPVHDSTQQQNSLRRCSHRQTPRLLNHDEGLAGPHSLTQVYTTVSLATCLHQDSRTLGAIRRMQQQK